MQFFFFMNTKCNLLAECFLKIITQVVRKLVKRNLSWKKLSNKRVLGTG